MHCLKTHVSDRIPSKKWRAFKTTGSLDLLWIAYHEANGEFKYHLGKATLSIVQTQKFKITIAGKANLHQRQHHFDAIFPFGINWYERAGTVWTGRL